MYIQVPTSVGEVARLVPYELPAAFHGFPLRTYRRTELAELYHPETSGKSAWEKFKYELTLCHPLQAALAAAGYDGRRRTFTPAEAWIIVQYLDIP